MTKDEVLKKVLAELQDAATHLSPDEIDTSIDRAFRKLCLDRPFALVIAITGDGTADYPLPATFIKGFTTIEQVEYPAGLSPPSYCQDNDDWYWYEDPSKSAGLQQRLRFKLSTPGATETIRVSMSGQYTFTEATSNLDPNADEAIIAKALVYCFRALAAKFAQSNDPTIGADSVDYGNRSQTYLFLSERHEADYKKAVGIGKDTKAAHAVADFDTPGEYTWHPRGSR